MYKVRSINLRHTTTIPGPEDDVKVQKSGGQGIIFLVAMGVAKDRKSEYTLNKMENLGISVLIFAK